MRTDGDQGRAGTEKVGVARKLSGESTTLQMGTSSHINSVCFPCVPDCLRIPFQRPVSSSLSCPPEVIFDLFTEGNGSLLSSPAPTSPFFPCVWLLLTFSHPRASLCNPDFFPCRDRSVLCAVRLVGSSSFVASTSFLSVTLCQMSAILRCVDAGGRELELSCGTASGKLGGN